MSGCPFCRDALAVLGALVGFAGLVFAFGWLLGALHG